MFFPRSRWIFTVHSCTVGFCRLGSIAPATGAAAELCETSAVVEAKLEGGAVGGLRVSGKPWPMRSGSLVGSAVPLQKLAEGVIAIPVEESVIVNVHCALLPGTSPRRGTS